MKIGNTEYFCAKKSVDDDLYKIYFSKDRYHTQITSKSDSFTRDKRKDKNILRKRKRERYTSNDDALNSYLKARKR
ncbi:MAG: hypothetical protein QXU18_00815 [Thermoplasmatales archaeon]